MSVQIESKSIQTYKPSAAMQELLARPYALPGDPAEDVYILGVSGGVDSSALAIWMTMKFPSVSFQYFFTDTQADHSETYKTLEMMEAFLGRKIEYIDPPKGLYDLVESYGGFLPSANKRYCTRELKIEPLERKMAEITPFMSMARVHSFVGLRSDEPGRVGYSSENDSHQIHFPFREAGIVKKDVFRIMGETSRIPRFYLHKSRSGCSCCPFQRKGELTMQIQWFPKDHERAKSIERLHPVDQARFKDDPIAATVSTGLPVTGSPIRSPHPGNQRQGKP